MWNRRSSFSLRVWVLPVVVALVVAVKPAEAITSTCIEGCVNQLCGDLEDCKWWLLKENYSESSYGDCVGAASSHASVCVDGCNKASGNNLKVGRPGGQYEWYNPGDHVILSAGLQQDSAYIHGIGPIAHVETYLLDLYPLFIDSTPFENRNWVPVGTATFDGDSLWQASVDMGSFPSLHGYLVRYDFTLQNDSTYVWVSSLISRSIVTAVPAESNTAPAMISFEPNPARDQTKISFRVPKAGPVSVTIYDLFGRRLHGWSWSNVAAGEHQVAWNWISDAGRPASSTIAFCRMTVDGKSFARRMIRLK